MVTSRRICLITGVLLLAFAVAGIIIAEQKTADLFALWRIPLSDPSFWNGFLLDHLTLWLIKFAGFFGLLFGLPGGALIRYGLHHRFIS